MVVKVSLRPPLLSAAVAFVLLAACAETGLSSAYPIDATFNQIGVDQAGTITWNSQRVSEAELRIILKREAALPVEPELRLHPGALAAYDVVDRVLAICQEVGVTKLGFVGNKAYEPGEGPK